MSREIFIQLLLRFCAKFQRKICITHFNTEDKKNNKRSTLKNFSNIFLCSRINEYGIKEMIE